MKVERRYQQWGVYARVKTDSCVDGGTHDDRIDGRGYATSCVAYQTMRYLTICRSEYVERLGVINATGSSPFVCGREKTVSDLLSALHSSIRSMRIHREQHAAARSSERPLLDGL